MTWYLTIRALCFVAFTAGICSLVGAGCMIDIDDRRAARRWVTYGFGFLVLGCVLVGLGWTPVHQ